MSFHNKCLLITIGILYLFCDRGECFNLNKLNGTWLVSHTSDPLEAEACPFIRMNTTKLNTTAFVYESNRTNAFRLMVNSSKTNTYPLRDQNNAIGNLTIYSGILPYYFVVAVKVLKETPTYLIMTGPNIPKDMQANLTKIWNETLELRNIKVYPVDHESLNCRSYIGKHVENVDGGNTDTKPEVITWPVISPTIKPVVGTTTKKPNGASGLNVSSIILLISMLFICT